MVSAMVSVANAILPPLPVFLTLMVPEYLSRRALVYFMLIHQAEHQLDTPSKRRATIPTSALTMIKFGFGLPSKSPNLMRVLQVVSCEPWSGHVDLAKSQYI